MGLERMDRYWTTSRCSLSAEWILKVKNSRYLYFRQRTTKCEWMLTRIRWMRFRKMALFMYLRVYRLMTYVFVKEKNWISNSHYCQKRKVLDGCLLEPWPFLCIFGLLSCLSVINLFICKRKTWNFQFLLLAQAHKLQELNGCVLK